MFIADELGSRLLLYHVIAKEATAFIFQALSASCITINDASKEPAMKAWFMATQC